MTENFAHYSRRLILYDYLYVIYDYLYDEYLYDIRLRIISLAKQIAIKTPLWFSGFQIVEPHIKFEGKNNW